MDISQFWEFEWFEWVMFQEKMALYLGRYLVPSIDVGPAMTAKIIKKNGQVLHRSTYQKLTQDKQDRGECKDKQVIHGVTPQQDRPSGYGR